MNRMKETPMNERRYELDWLRVLAILVVFLFHSTRFFNLGDWIDLHPAGSYAWASNGAHPSSMVLKQNGQHRIRLQPRQTPHRIDQIWLSRFQWAVPETAEPITR